MLYEVEDEGIALSTEVAQYVVGTLQLSELLNFLPLHTDPTKGSVVITSASRVDILLGLIQLHESKSPSSLAAVVLTGGRPPPKEVDALVKGGASKGTLPILSSPLPTFETAAALANVEGYITAKAPRKIERAQMLFDDHIDINMIKRAILQERPVRMNSKLFQYNLFSRAKQQPQTIVLPEGDEPRTLQAAGAIIRRGLCNLILLGNKQKIETMAKQFHVDISAARIVNPEQSPDLEKYAHSFYEARKHKGMTLEKAREILLEDVNYFGTVMVAAGDADGMVSGAIHTTSNTVRPALQIIKTQPGLPVVSSVFFMCLPGKVLVYGDCAINSNPSSEELAAIAVASADTAAAFGITPRVAMLSYATGDSNTGPLIQKVIDATAIAKKKRPDLQIEGPLQYDAAVDPAIAKTKMKGADNPVAGKATVLIFPDLNTGNNTYKAVQQSTGAVAMGPLLQGLRKPVNDLSRGCTVADIVTTIALTAVQAAAMKEKQQQQQQQQKPNNNLAASAA
jgi:phosphate acetyltransferase